MADFREVVDVMTTPSTTHCAVDVIVPCYNVEDCVERALNSVFAQSHRNLCVYAVDDGSKDRTPQVLEKYAGRCTVLRQTHAGQAAARNRGIRMSESPYVAFIDADDEWLPAKIERQISWLEQEPDLGFVCSLCAPGKAQANDWETLERPSNSSHTADASFEQLLRACFVFTPTVVARRRCLDGVGLFNESLAVSEDFNLWLRIASRWKIAMMPDVLAIRHMRANGLSQTTAPEAVLRNGIAALEDVRSNCPGLSAKDENALLAVLCERYYDYASYLLAAGSRMASRGNFRMTLRLQPFNWHAIAKLGLSYLPQDVFNAVMAVKRSYDSLPKSDTQLKLESRKSSPV
jgi:glycosyltransferase involved in cell wall biosynthesis